MQLRCFPRIRKVCAPDENPVVSWVRAHPDPTMGLSLEQKAALAELIPVLLCGEQSAQYVFGKESVCEGHAAEYGRVLAQIELEEQAHELALQHLLVHLPISPNAQSIKQRSRKFYHNLAKLSNNTAAHFMCISYLDTCVCILLNELGRSDLGQTQLAELIRLLKRDEARHVRVSRKYAKNLHFSASPENRGVQVGPQLVLLLEYHTEALTQMGVDTQTLFERLYRIGGSI